MVKVEWLSCGEYAHRLGVNGAAMGMRVVRGTVKPDLVVTTPKGPVSVFRSDRPELTGRAA